MRFSLIIPVYNRPDEIQELLESLTDQTLRDFEVIVVEDGSDIPCQDIVSRYAQRLDVHYYMKANSGPGQTRNYGAERAHGEYIIVLDSDCVIPSGYIREVAREIDEKDTDAFGGPDRAHDSFTDVQKAISYSMTSFLTTGGIRGGKKKLDKFYPRSFNMGMKASVYNALGGFSKMRFGEDIDFSIRIFKNGYSCRLFPEAWVWHKRRTDFRKFFRQVYNSGMARIHLYKRYPDSLKIVHLLPMAFTLGMAVLLLAAILLAILGSSLWIAALLPALLFSVLVLADSSIRNGNLKIGCLSVIASWIQLTGYGMGFLHAWYGRCISHREEFGAFEKNFYS